MTTWTFLRLEVVGGEILQPETIPPLCEALKSLAASFSRDPEDPANLANYQILRIHFSQLPEGIHPNILHAIITVASPSKGKLPEIKLLCKIFEDKFEIIQEDGEGFMRSLSLF